VVDNGGISYAFRLGEEMTATATDAVRAFVIATRVFGLIDLWNSVHALDNVLPTEVQDDLVLESRRLLDRASRWLLRNRPQPLQVGPEIERFRPVVSDLAPKITQLLRGRDAAEMRAGVDRLVQRGVPAELANRVAGLLPSFGLLDVTEVARQASKGRGGLRSAQETAELYYALSEYLDMNLMFRSVTALERGNRWHALARLALRDDLYDSLRAITFDVLRAAEPGTTPEERIAVWERTNASRLARARHELSALAEDGQLDLATVSVAVRQIRSMAR
jgi:glutamate dehydrogenase